MMKLRVIRSVTLAAALVVIGLAGGAARADHDTRFVTVNGTRLSPAQIVYAEQAIGYPLPSGFYWYDEASGYWGVVGWPAIGRISTNNRGNGGGGGRRGGQYPILIDPTGGCEGGSCVNILD